jgi:hypothetical protein
MDSFGSAEDEEVWKKKSQSPVVPYNHKRHDTLSQLVIPKSKRKKTMEKSEKAIVAPLPPEPVGPVQFIKFVTKRAFGIELEVNRNITLNKLTEAVKYVEKDREVMSSSTYSQDSGNNYWHVKFDRSCGNRSGEGGWEVASYKASGTDDLIKISNMGAALKAAGAEVNDNCGYHIHCEIADFKTEQAATLVARWMKIEDIILEICPKNRRENIYCRKLRTVKPVVAHDLRTAEAFWLKVRPTSMDNPERRVTFNMCNYALGSRSKRTVELRLPEGTLEPKDIKNWCRLFVHFVNYTKKQPLPKDVDPVMTLKDAATILGLHNEDPFYILSSGLYETKSWFLSRAIQYAQKKSLRNEAQDLLNFMIPPISESAVNTKKMIVPAIPKEKIKPKKSKVKIEEIKSPWKMMDYDDTWQSYKNDL